jgi:aspartyl-tRNA(Asn)/glutamyl-tRNA(Gln) amidotransferase subunit C
MAGASSFMPAPDKIEVTALARLARINLTLDEAAKLGAQLDQILAYVEKLRQLDVSSVQPTAHAVPLVNVTRPDCPEPPLPPEQVLRNAPAQANGLFLVPKIVE